MSLPRASAALLLCGLLASTSGCREGLGAPATPSPIDAPLTVPAFLDASVALIDSDGRPVPLLGEAAGPWLRRVIRGVVVDPALPAHVRAQCCTPGRLVRWSNGWRPDPGDPDEVRIAAAILVHEGRHAEGYRHTCADHRRDRSYEEAGAWALHAAWLRHMGDGSTADTILAFDIGCR